MIVAVMILRPLAAGLAVGALTWVAQTLPGLSAVNNSGAVWSAAAWGVVALLGVTGRRAAVAGALVLLGADTGYYLTTALVLHDDINRYPFIWALVALVAGPIFGLAGAAWRHGSADRGGWGVGTLAGVFVAEAIYLTVAFHTFRSLTPAVLAAAALAFLPRTPRQRRVAGLATVAWTAAAGIGYGLLWLWL